MSEAIGLIAGKSKFPILVAQAAREKGLRVVAVAHSGQTLPELEKYVDEIHWVKVGQLGRIIKILKGAGVHQALMAGGITKSIMFFDLRPDFRALITMARLKSRNDDAILRAVAGEIEKEGISILDSTTFLSSLVAPPGFLTRRRPSKREMEDIQFGWEVAKEFGRLDIGQSIVVKEKAVLAVEAMEGTDETIRRGASFSGPGAVVVKVSKPTQDMRFDAPTVGAGTVAVLKECNIAAMAIEAGKTLIIDKEEAIALADKGGISLVAL